jgi:hypothetical protein
MVYKRFGAVPRTDNLSLNLCPLSWLSSLALALMNDRLPGKLPHEIWCKAFQLFPENQKALLGLVTSSLFHIMLGRRYENVEFRHSDSSQRTTDALQYVISEL